MLINTLETISAKLIEDNLEYGYFVRITDGMMGTSGLSFCPNHVDEIYKQVYDWEIRLK